MECSCKAYRCTKLASLVRQDSSRCAPPKIIYKWLNKKFRLLILTLTEIYRLSKGPKIYDYIILTNLPVNKRSNALRHSACCLIPEWKEVDKLCVEVHKGTCVPVSFVTNRQWTYYFKIKSTCNR